MPNGRSKMLLNGNVMSGVPPLQRVFDTPTDERHELEVLRSANARLMRELAELRKREARAQRLADRDGLTGAYTHRRMMELLESAIAEAAQQRWCVGLLFIDLNGFKGINDEYGHAAGDQLLTSVTMRINARVRAGDMVCRYGGDEFVVILPNVPDPAATAQVADIIRERLALPYRIAANEQHLTAAIGESTYPHQGASAQELLLRADRAMYLLKARSSRPMLSLGGSRRRPSRRHGDVSKPGMDDDFTGGDP